ncbi:MAG: hypothetical protein HY810_00985 [Candidatus Omnitrophica bacterium]|nr:hypothetical protein [Candidatus Omnitrophota bacterium]
MKFDYIAAFYSEKHTEDTLLRGVDSLLGSYPDFSVRMFPVYIEPAYWLKIKEGNKNLRLLKENQGIYLFEFGFEATVYDEKKKISGMFYAIKSSQYDNIFVLLTIENSLFFKQGLLPYFKKAYPLASLTFITHKRLKNLLIDFRDKNQFKDFTIVRTTTYSRVDKNKIMPSVNWPAFTLEKAFEWVADENGWFQNLLFKFKKPQGQKHEASISRNGVVKSTGYAKLIYDYFMEPISKTVFENVTFFSKRSRRDNPNRDIRPLCINFGYDKFNDVEENQRFIASMRPMKASSLSVVHGNPYVHLSLFDYFDGSSFDIWVLSSDKIIIVPQLKASFQAIKRLLNHVFDNYAEGEIQDYKVEEQ